MANRFKSSRQVQLARLKKRVVGALRSGRSKASRLLRNDDQELAEYEAMLDARSHEQANLESRIRLRLGEEGGDALVPSEIAYSAEAMRAVSRRFIEAMDNYVSVRWKGPTFVLRTAAREDDSKFVRTFLPNAKSRITKYPHKTLFTDGLSEILNFLNDALGADAEKTFDK